MNAHIERRYTLTERVGKWPSDLDPLAQAISKHSGVFDLRDAGNSNVICATSVNLRAIRQQQARLNSATLML